MNNTPDNENNRTQVQTDTPQSENNPLSRSLPQRKKYNYTLTHGIFALLTFILGSLWYRWLFFHHTDSIFRDCHAMGITVFALLFFAISVAFFKIRKKEIGTDAFIIMCAALIFSLRFTLYPNDTYSFISGLAFFVLHITALLFLYCVGTKNALDKIVGSIIKSVLYEPFASFHRIFTSLSVFFKVKKPSTEQQKQKSKQLVTNISLVLLTLFCIIPVITAVLALLFSDGFFSDYLGDVANILSEIDIDFRIGDYFNIITILVSMFIFGAIFSADKKAEEEIKPSQSCNILPQIIGKTVLVTLILIYTLFVTAQIDGFAHMFMGILPEGVTYAEFARSGFFEICTVACINGGVLFLIELLTVKASDTEKISITKILLIIFTILLIFTAAAKMTMYITAYGFTPKRFYTLWFMLLLTVLFIMAFFKLRNRNFKLSRYSVYVTLVFLALLFLVNFEWLSAYLNNLIQ